MAFDIENLFKAVDILVERRLENVNFDRTIICTIIDDSDKKNGCYIVSDGTIKFKAYANDTSYKTDDQVRVSVLNGDFSEKKFISGRYTEDEESTPITYKSPLESIIPITGNLVTHTKYSDSDGVNGLIANDSVTSLDIWSIDLTSNQSFRDLQSNGIYNTLTIKADFKTLLSHYDLVAGNYGLRLDLFIQPSLNSTQRIRKYITLDSSEMLGNPYSFSIYSTQAKKVDIVSTGIISEMVLWIYQGVNGDGGSGRFIDRDGKEIPVNAFKNILIKNIEIGFGSDIETTPDNTIELFTSSPPYYVYKDPTNETNRKELEVLWYNKTENNEYVGFSDGLYDPTYDEIEYLKKSNFNSRLMAQVGRTDVPSDEPGLKLSADLKDAKPIMIKARDALTNAVADVLYNLQRQVQSANSIYTKIDKLVDTVNGGLVQQWKKANDNLELWNSAYSGALQYAYDKQNAVETPKAWDSAWETDYYTKFKSDIELGIKLVRDFFVWFDGQTQPTALQSGHRGNYDLYFYRIEIELEKIEDWLDELDALLSGNFAKLKAYKSNGYIFYEYKQTDFSAYDNKYCLYWYRYEPGYKLEYKKDANNDEFNYGKFMTDGWRRMTEISQNYGLPAESYVSELDGKTYYKAKPIGQKVIRDMVRELTEEKYAVILFYNHEMYQSNIVTFTNSEPELIPAEELLDAKDTLKIEHYVSSLEHYQVYNEFNQLRSLDDGGRIRQLKCFYQGLYKQNEALVEAGLYWYIPNHNTMLTIDTDYLQGEGFSTDAGGRTEHSIDGYTYYYKKIKPAEITNDDGSKITTSNEADRIFYYKIKPMLEKDATNNTIKVRAYLKGMEKPVEGDITMTFSTFGSNGTKYTLSVVPSGSQVSVMENKPLQLKVGLRDYNNTPIKIVDVQKTDLSVNNAYGFQVSNWDRSPNAFDISTIFDETNTYVEGLTVLLNRAGGAKNWDKTQPYFGIINAKVTYYIANTEENNEEKKVTNYDKSQTVTLNTLVPLTYASNNYYMSGATTIVYNNQGTVSYVSEDEYLLYQVNQKGQTPIKNQVWSIRYYDKTGRYVAPGTDEYEMLENYMPVLKQGENRLVPAPLYIENLDYIPVVICTVNGDFAWAQPIIITQNQYASSTLNSWNGSLTIDEKNGTILSSMIGAGRKTDHNTFEGVLMGNIAVGTNSDIGFEKNTDIGYSNHTGLGLYGFHDGAQSFGFNVDGTAFLGKSGRGRIIFNGNQGVIASSNWFLSGGKLRRDLPRDGETQIEVFGTDGMCIDLENGHIDAYNFKLTSKNIYLNSSPVTSGPMDYYFRIGNTGIEGEEAPTPGILTFDREGHLILQADRFTLNSNLGGTNLLLNTAPVQYLGDNNGTSSGTNPTTGEGYTNSTTGWMWDFSPWTPTNIITITNDTNKVKMSIFNVSTKTGISQVIEDIKVGKEYTASVYVYPKGNQVISMATKSGIVTSTLHDEWEYLTLVFTAEENDTITFAADSNNFQIWHPKVEEGTVATTWGASPKDTVKAQERANAMFTQNNMWSVLSQNGTLQGTWLVDNKLYINAEFITAGALASVNWKNSGGMIADDGTITNYGSAGMAISLKTGEIHSANFHLVAGTSGKLELNSDPGVNKPYLFVGNNNNYISFKRTDESNNTSLAIASNIFTLTAGTENNIITIDSQAQTYPLSIADNFQVEWDGTLHASGAVISGDITATTINVTGTGSIGNWKVTADGNLQSSNSKVVLNGSTGAISGATISGATISGGTLNIGNGNFTVSSGGHMVCNSATIGGWTVTADKFSGNGISFAGGTGGGISSPYWNVGTDGKTEIKDLTISTSLTTKNSCNVYIDGKIGIGAKNKYTYDLYVNAKAYIKGNIGIGTTPSDDYALSLGGALKIKTGSKLYIGESEYIYAATNGLFILGGFIDLSSDEIEIGTDGSKVEVWGSMHTYGDFTIDGNANFTSPENILVNGEQTLPEYIEEFDNFGFITIDNGSKYVNYAKVAQKIGKNATTLTTLGKDNQPIYLNNGEFTAGKTLGGLAYMDSIKKKVNITMTGSYTVPMKGYYTRSGPYTGYNVTDAAAYARAWRYCYYQGGKVYGPVEFSEIPDGAPFRGFYMAYDDGNDYVINNGSFEYYTTTAASNRTFNLTGSKTLEDQEFVASDTDDDIDFTVSDITFTVSSIIKKD